MPGDSSCCESGEVVGDACLLAHAGALGAPIFIAAIVADGRTMGERPGLICGLVAGSEPDAVTDEHSDAVWMGLRSVEECAVVVDETRIGSAATGCSPASR